jgi:hypothetical protein
MRQSHSNTYPQADLDTNRNPQCHRYGNPRAGGDTHADSHTGPHTDRHRNATPNGDSYPHTGTRERAA